MFVNRKIVVLLIVLLSLIFIFLFGIEKRSGFSYDKKMPADFNFSAKVEFDTYTLDTYNNSLIKIIDWENDTLIAFQLTNDFKEKIFNILREIDINKYPENYAPTSTIEISPSSNYYFKYTINSRTRELKWVENTESETKDAKKLRSLFKTILDFLKQDKIVKTLPESKRGYL